MIYSRGMKEDIQKRYTILILIKGLYTHIEKCHEGNQTYVIKIAKLESAKQIELV